MHKQYYVWIKLINENLSEYCKKLSEFKPAELYAPSIYTIELGGKRIRPLLALIACDLFGKQAKQAIRSALAVELFHNFSLIHDDILDNAPIRRKKASAHIKWNKNIALLSGDMLLVKSFQCLDEYNTKEFNALSKVFYSMAVEVCQGQQMDMNFENMKKVSVAEYIQMISYKTGSLLGCSLQMGAINAGAGVSNQKLIREFGVNLGIAFQLNDDYLDLFASSDQFGKINGGDILTNKKTFLLLNAFQKSNQKQRHILQSTLSDSLISPEEKIKTAKNLFIETGSDEDCLKAAELYTDKALICLKGIKTDEIKKKKLKNFALDLLKRNL